MSTPTAITGRVTITAKDINNNNVAKVFNAVAYLSFDYVKGMVSILDVTGNFYFPLLPLTTLTYTINGTVHTIVTS